MQSFYKSYGTCKTLFQVHKSSAQFDHLSVFGIVVIFLVIAATLTKVQIVKILILGNAIDALL